MEANQTNSRLFANKLKAARPADRAKLMSSYAAWVRTGAKSQGIWLQLLAVVGAGAAFAGIDGWFSGVRSPLYLIVCGFATLTGILAFMLAARREKRWRQANPWKQPEG